MTILDLAIWAAKNNGTVNLRVSTLNGLGEIWLRCHINGFAASGTVLLDMKNPMTPEALDRLIQMRMDEFEQLKSEAKSDDAIDE